MADLAREGVPVGCGFDIRFRNPWTAGSHMSNPPHYPCQAKSYDNLQFQGLGDDDRDACCPRNVAAERRTTSEICRSCLARGVVLRQTMPMIRDGCGLSKRA